MVWDAHLVAGLGEEVIVFGASLFGSRFDSVGSPWELVFGDELEELVVESDSFSGGGGLSGGGVLADGVEAAFEAEGSEVYVVLVGCFLHDEQIRIRTHYYTYHIGIFRY